MPQKFIHKAIKVITDQNIVKGQKQHGYPMRKWKMSLMGVNANGEEETLPYVDYVEYVLHVTFDQPIRKVTTYPFTLQEKGWGEFDMKIRLYFKDKSIPPAVLDHDLNFQSTHYEIPHNLTFNKADVKASFMKLLNPPAENISDKDSQYSNESSHDGAANKRRREALLKENAKRAREDRSSDDDSQDSSADVSEDELNGKVNIHVLAKKFQKLDAEDLMELVKLVKANQTADMYVKEDGEAGEFHIDLQTLGDDLLNTLWHFCTARLEA
ncbi:hypothetical protein CPB97_002042 [Podila verticillata]|nr:hypothetical protein CPB97_002042 [Podila verticillata]